MSKGRHQPHVEVNDLVAQAGKRPGTIVAVVDEGEHGYVYVVRVSGLRARAPMYTILVDSDFTSGRWDGLGPVAKKT